MVPRATPVYLTAGFEFEEWEQAAGHFGAGEAFAYTRTGNPTTAAVEQRIAALEGGADALFLASGQAANPDDATLLRIAEQRSSDLETDLTALDLDKPLPTGLFGDHVSQGSIKRLVGEHDLATTPLRVLLGGLARLGRIADHSGWVGTAGELADLIEELGEWGNDGVLLWGDLHPVTVHGTLDELVPILRRRGILRTEWADGGLRANLRAF
ncbi:PLP-dependent transferase [Promicromonospora kroppenstedtii]